MIGGFANIVVMASEAKQPRRAVATGLLRRRTPRNDGLVDLVRHYFAFAFVGIVVA
jgi:predicted component of type VI protein secretion system